MPSDWSVRNRIGSKLTTDPDLAVVRLAAGQWSVLSLAELFSCGLSRREVHIRVRRGRLHPLYRGVCATGHRNIPLEGHFLAAVQACGPHAVLSHYAAACLHGWLNWDGRPIDVTAPTKRTHARIKAHRSDTIERIVLKRIQVTPRVRTLIDLSRVTDLATFTRAVRQARLSPTEVATLPTTGKFARLLSAAPTRSPLEDEVLNLVLRSGLQHPDVNAPYRLPDRPVYPDLRWPALRLVVEVDSQEWHDDPLAQADDRRRQADLEADGERVLRITNEHAKRRPKQTLARLRAAGVPDA